MEAGSSGRKNMMMEVMNDGDDDSQHATKKRQGHRFEEELTDDVALARADCFSNADFARALGDAHQHDVHHADAADQQTDSGDGDRETGRRTW